MSSNKRKLSKQKTLKTLSEAKNVILKLTYPHEFSNGFRVTDVATSI